MSIQISEELKFFIIQHSSLEYNEIDASMQLERDFPISGDEALAFLLAYQTTFNIDMTNFKFLDFFDDEQHVLSSNIYRLLSKFFMGSIVLPHKVITVLDLQKGINKKRLDMEVILSTFS